MQHVVIWGCARSGTSIVYEAWRSHPGYQAFFEPGEWLLGDMDWTHPIAIKNPWSNSPTAGLSANLHTVLEFPAKHIWVVRHPHDTAASLRPGMNSQPHPPALPDKWRGKPLIDRCAALWRYVNETGLDNLQVKVEVLTVRYEDLLKDPLTTTARMMEYTETPWAPELDQYLNSISLTPGENEAEFQSRWSRPHNRHINREDLTEVERVTIDNIVGDVPKNFGYGV
jgi:hypothetical protein